MEKQEKEFPYNFNVMREYKIYKNIGNIQNNLLKKLAGHKKKENFSKYSEWEKYFKYTYLARFTNLYDFQCYLNKKKRNCELILKIHDKVYIPIVLAEVSVFFAMANKEKNIGIWGFMFALLLATIGITIKILIEYSGRKDFYTKCISIIKEEERKT